MIFIVLCQRIRQWFLNAKQPMS